MSYLHIEDFKSGLDTRRSVYTAPPGSLRVCKNAHITRGGEVEKRLAFASFADLSGAGGATYGIHAAQGSVWTFGSAALAGTLAGGVRYQRLQHPDGVTAMTALLAADNFNGKIYVVAQFADDAVYHYYDGARVTAWDSMAGTLSTVSGVATALTTQLQDEGPADFTITNPSGNQIRVESPAASAFSYEASGTGGATMTATLDQAATYLTGANAASGSFQIAGGSSSPGVNQVTSVKINGTEVLGAPVDWNTSDGQTASDVADQITNYQGGVGYYAYVLTTKTAPPLPTDTVQILASSADGSTPNGYTIAVTTSGDVVASNITNMGGGTDSGAVEQSQMVTFTLGGAVTASSQWALTIKDQTFTVRGTAGLGRTALALKDKMYSSDGPLLYFSGYRGSPPVPDPTAFGTSIDGAGFINLSTQNGGSQEITGLGVYQNYLAAFSRNYIQTWQTDPDPDKYQQVQVLDNIGTRAPKSIKAYGEVDLFFLADSGIRSLRARDSSNLAASQDVGTPIDDDVLTYMAGLTAQDIEGAVSVIEPDSSRYMLALGTNIYVFSHFPGSNVSAWSTYDLGVQVTDFAASDGRVYARAGDQVYLYGGASGTEFDACQPEIVTPFLDMNAPASSKTLMGIDIGAEGSWDVYVAVDPAQPTLYERVGTLSGSTYGLQPAFFAQGESTHFSFKLVNTDSSYAKLANMVVHYRSNEAA